MDAPQPSGPATETLPLILAAARMCIVYEPRLVARLRHELSCPFEQWPAELHAALERALRRVAEGCADPTPEMIPCWFEEPPSGKRHRIPREAIWRALRCGTTEEPARASDDRHLLPSLRIFAAAIADTWPDHPRVDPRRSVQIGVAALEARASPMFQLGAFQWIDAVEGPPKVPTSDEPEAMEMITTLDRMVSHWLALIPEPFEPTQSLATDAVARPRLSTKDAVARREAESRRRWLAKEWDDPKEARDALEDDLNKRPDRSVAKPGDRDYHTRATIDRLTRRWFDPR